MRAAWAPAALLRPHPSPPANTALMLSVGCRSIPHCWGRPSHGTSPACTPWHGHPRGWGRTGTVGEERQAEGCEHTRAPAALSDHPVWVGDTDHAMRQRRVRAGPTAQLRLGRQTLTPSSSGANTEWGLQAPSCA